jgi:predicted amidohydrolase YtcJ
VTINAAWQAREEKYKGSIEEGKDADLIVVSADPLTIDYKDIRFIKVLQTIKDGGILYTNQDYNSNL